MRTLALRWTVWIAAVGVLTVGCDLSVVDPSEIFISPSDGEVLTDDTPYLEWFAQTAATEYEVQVDDDTGFGSPEVYAGSANTSHTVANPLPSGTYHWRIRALQRGTWSTWSQSWSFVIEVPPPPTPVLSAPSDGYASTDDSAVLGWEAATGAIDYRVQLDDDASFGSPDVDQDTGSTSLAVGPLTPETYHWRVRAQNAAGSSPWSEARSFTVEELPPPPAAPPHVAPADGSSSIDVPSSLAWTEVDGAVSYRVQLDDDPAFGSPETDESTTGATSAVPGDLPPGTYYWRVQATNEGGASPWTAAWSFTVEPPPPPPPPPDPPTLLAPADGFSATDIPANLSWGSVQDADSYTVQLDDSPGFGSPEVAANTLALQWAVPGSLGPDTYHWRVRSENANGPSDWSTTWSFTVETEDPGPGAPGGLGIVGDSNADEYRADNNRGGAYGESTFNWVELLVRYRGIDVGPWGSRGEPRRTGYEYNWARSGATASSAMSSGQHTGLAQQIADGRVSTAVIDIGTNDFSPTAYGRIYNGSLSGSALQQKIDRFVERVTEIVETLLDAGSPQVLLALVADRGLDSAIVSQYPDPDKRQRVTDAINAVNAGLVALAQENGIATWNPSEFAQSLFSNLNSDQTLDVGGESIQMIERGNEPHHARLDDSSGHAGTVISGLLANSMYLETFSDFYGLGLTPFSDAEILGAAGID